MRTGWLSQFTVSWLPARVDQEHAGPLLLEPGSVPTPSARISRERREGADAARMDAAIAVASAYGVAKIDLLISAPIVLNQRRDSAPRRNGRGTAPLTSSYIWP